MTEKREPGRYSEELVLDLCVHIAEGGSLRSFCYESPGKKNPIPGRPTMRSVYLWMQKYPEFEKMYERAREDQADSMADEILDIADDENIDVKRARLMVDTRKWLASKIKAKKYGDKLDLTTRTAKLSELSDDELAAIAAGSRD